MILTLTRNESKQFEFLPEVCSGFGIPADQNFDVWPDCFERFGCLKLVLHQLAWIDRLIQLPTDPNNSKLRLSFQLRLIVHTSRVAHEV